jgi:hypothetical protein
MTPGRRHVMLKVKTFTTQLKIFHVTQELHDLDKAVNDFIESEKIKKVISVSDTATSGTHGEVIGLIRVVTYEA